MNEIQSGMKTAKLEMSNHGLINLEVQEFSL